MIDMRSDTVTVPTPAMRRAMAEAEVGDDVYGEDPTVNRLERRAAEIAGKEAALFVPSGTMGNNIAIKLHTEHGQEVICEARAHILDWELAMMAWFSGCIARTIHSEDGILRWSEIRKSVKRASAHRAPTGLIEIENTHNMAGGAVYPIDVINEICDEAHALGIRVHMDGARVFNAACYLNKPVSDITAKADTVMFCLSKGLGAPVGSMLAGTEEAIARGRLYRKRLGGAMRQAGVLAAAGLIALEEMPKRLAEDHANARLLAAAVAVLPGVRLDPARVRTNIVIFDVTGTGLSSTDFSTQCANQGLRVSTANPACVRMLTHLNVSRADCERAIEVLRAVCEPV
ncbi:MAG: threonine aldolase family protein [Bryobacteraceae bacterium]